MRLLNNAGWKEDNAGPGVVRWPYCEAHSYCGTTSTYCRTPDFRPNTVEASTAPGLRRDAAHRPNGYDPDPALLPMGPRLLQQRLEWSSGAIKQRAFRGGLGAWAPWDLGRALGGRSALSSSPLAREWWRHDGERKLWCGDFWSCMRGASQSSRLP